MGGSRTRAWIAALVALLAAGCGGGGGEPAAGGATPSDSAAAATPATKALPEASDVARGMAEKFGEGSPLHPAKPHPGSVGDRLTVIYVNNLDGEIEPCG